MDKKSFIFLCIVTATFLITQQYFDNQRHHIQQETQAVVPTPQPPPKPIEPSGPYYALKSPYQTLIFSPIGGSIVEINLPFKTKTFEKSAVLKVEADEQLHESFPAVPALDYKGKNVSEEPSSAYPLLRRIPFSEKSAPHYATAISSIFPEVATLPYTVKQFTENSITFEAKQPHRIITKTYSFPKDPEKFPYCFLLNITIQGDRKNLFLSSGIPEVELISGSTGATLKYRLEKATKGVVEKIDLPSPSFTSTTLSPDWICTTNGFFGIILDPIAGTSPGFSFEKVEGAEFPSRLQKLSPLSEPDQAGYEAKLPLSPAQETMTFRVFAGPLSDNVLSTVDKNALVEGGKLTHYTETQSFHGFFAFIAEPFARFLFFIMKQFYALFGSWALSIIGATVILRLLLYPLNAWSMKSAKAMQEIGPQVKAIQEKYAKTPTKAQMEIMNLYREKKVNPFSGCLPLLIQMPFLLGMFDLLKTSFELRGASFIPGWIPNLAAPDSIYTFSFALPFLGNSLHLLPIFLGFTMWLQQHLSANLSKNPNEWTDQQRQQRTISTIMTVVMTVMFYHFPAGLNIYWISSMVLGIIQQLWVNASKKP